MTWRIGSMFAVLSVALSSCCMGWSECGIDTDAYQAERAGVVSLEAGERMVVDVVVTATEGAVWAEFGGVSTRVSYGTEPPVTLDARLVDARNGDEITNEFNTTAFVCQDGRCVAQLQFILPGLEEDRITADWAVKTQWEVPRTESESGVSLEVSEPKIEPVGS